MTMKKTTIRNVQNLTGFATNGAKEGEGVWILQRASASANDPYFYMLMNQLDGHFLRPADINGDSITHFFALSHKDGTADVYTGYSQVQIEMKPKRDLAKGEPVYISDIDDVRRYEIEGIDFLPDDAVICVMKVGWKYGLFFDFTRSTNAEEVWLQLGQLYNGLHVDRIIENIQNSIKEAEKPHFITEGKTDWKHLEAARRDLAPELTFSYPASEDTLGDVGLLKMCDQLSKFGPQNKNKVIAIFDRDNPSTLKELMKHGNLDGYQEWGNNVYSLAIPIPKAREKYENPSIEFLYSDTDLARKDKNGKRLFFNNEIKKEITPKEVRTFSVAPETSMEYGKKVFDELADQITDEKGNKVAISKARFAELILEQTDDFKNVKFDGFQPLIEVIKSILNFDPTKE
jgi:RNA-directed DNA polymerase